MPNSPTHRLYIFTFLGVLLFTIYSNTFHASWHLDDKPNIVGNDLLHLNSLHPKKLINTFFTDPSRPGQLNTRLNRPVSCMTFALNWYVGQDRVIGYHIVNTVIHTLTAFFLYIFILTLFKTPNLKDNFRSNPILIAFLTSVLWAVNPIQTQAVTYIVQRMAQLAAFFYLLGLLAYTKARLSHGIGKPAAWFASCVCFYLLGLYSKPNAAMLPMAIILIEIVFFQNLADSNTRKKVYFAGAIVTLFVILCGSILFLRGDPLSILDRYNKRTFTIVERALAQPRVILFYLSQIFLPLPNRFSVAHDVVLSSSLFKPWTTLPSILIIGALVGFGGLQIRKRPILCFSILFFFLNHIIESSIIGLEIIFEHRNYLPSFFLFLPMACLLDQLLQKYQTVDQYLYKLTVIFIIFSIGFFSTSTYLRNSVWKDEVSLWLNAAKKAPNHYRPLHNLAVNLAWGDSSNHPKRYDMALDLFKEALTKYIPSNHVKSDIYGNMALIYFNQKNDSQKALENFEKALDIYPDYHKVRMDLIETLVTIRDFDKALEQVDLLIVRNGENGKNLNIRGLILLWKGQYQKALSCFKKAFPLLKGNSSVLLNSAVTLSMAGAHGNAEHVLIEAIKQFPEEMPFYFAAIENSLRARSKDQASVYARELLKIYTNREINHGIESFSDNPKFAPLSAAPIRRVFEYLEAKNNGNN